jgi:hypothetical protein
MNFLNAIVPTALTLTSAAPVVPPHHSVLGCTTTILTTMLSHWQLTTTPTQRK